MSGDDTRVLMPYSGVYVQEVAKLLEEAVPSVPSSQRGAIARYLLDGLHTEGLLAETPWKAAAVMWRNRALAAERLRDKAVSQAAISAHTRSWEHVKTQLELDQALRVVRLAEALHMAADPTEHEHVYQSLVAEVDVWLQYSLDETVDPVDEPAPVPDASAEETVAVAEIPVQPTGEEPSQQSGEEPAEEEAPAEV